MGFPPKDRLIDPKISRTKFELTAIIKLKDGWELRHYFRRQRWDPSKYRSGARCVLLGPDGESGYLREDMFDRLRERGDIVLGETTPVYQVWKLRISRPAINWKRAWRYFS